MCMSVTVVEWNRLIVHPFLASSSPQIDLGGIHSKLLSDNYYVL